MVLIVISVHTITADEEEIFKLVQKRPYHREVIVGAEIGGIGFRLPHNNRVDDVPGINELQQLQFSDGELFHLRVGFRPEFISLIAEIFRTDPGVARIFN